MRTSDRGTASARSERGRQAAREIGAAAASPSTSDRHRDGAFHHPGGRQQSRPIWQPASSASDRIGRPTPRKALPDQRRDPEAHDYRGRRAAQAAERAARLTAFGGLVRLGLGRLLDRAPAAEGGHRAPRGSSITTGSPFPEPWWYCASARRSRLRLHPHDGVARLVEIVRPPENVHGDRIAFEDAARPSSVWSRHGAENRWSRVACANSVTVQDALQSAPRLVGRHFAAARQPSVPKTAD